MNYFRILQLFSEGEAAGDFGATDGVANRPQEQEDAPVSAPKMTWEEIKADPELKQHLQEMVKTRLKSARHAEESLAVLTPALRTLAQSYGMDENYDPAALAEAVSADRRFQKEDLKSHFLSLREQALLLKEQIPDFSLEKELENPLFLRLTAPNGVSLEDAYYTVHRRDLQRTAMAATAATTARQISNAIAAGAMRPRENGSVAAAPAVTTFDWRSADRSRREEMKKKIRQAAARGEKVYPNDLF